MPMRLSFFTSFGLPWTAFLAICLVDSAIAAWCWPSFVLPTLVLGGAGGLILIMASERYRDPQVPERGLEGLGEADEHPPRAEAAVVAALRRDAGVGVGEGQVEAVGDRAHHQPELPVPVVVARNAVGQVALDPGIAERAVGPERDLVAEWREGQRHREQPALVERVAGVTERVGAGAQPAAQARRSEIVVHVQAEIAIVVGESHRGAGIGDADIAEIDLELFGGLQLHPDRHVDLEARTARQGDVAAEAGEIEPEGLRTR